MLGERTEMTGDVDRGSEPIDGWAGDLIIFILIDLIGALYAIVKINVDMIINDYKHQPRPSCPLPTANETNATGQLKSTLL